MRYGLEETVLNRLRQAFSSVNAIEKIVLYGSRAKGNYRTGSDIDITLFGSNLTLDNSVYPLMDEIEKLYMPYSFDISIFEHIDNEQLVDHIKRVGKILYRKEDRLLQE